jgi:hypothetical protein
MNTLTKKKQEIEAEVWLCRDCGFSVFHSKKPNNCSCGNRSSYFKDTQMSSLIRRIKEKERKRFDNFVKKLKENKILELTKFQKEIIDELAGELSK